MDEWKSIESAPTYGRIDVWAKRWVAKTDEFEYRRFVDCFWRSTHFGGVPKEWHPTHWMTPPEPPRSLDSVPGTEHARRWETAA